MTSRTVVAAVGAIALVACSDPSGELGNGPVDSGQPVFALSPPATCSTPATVVVTNEAGLVAALGAASSGTVIALNGLFVS